MRTVALAVIVSFVTLSALAAGPPAKIRPAWKAPDPAPEQAALAEPLAIVGADVHPVTRPVVEGGVLLLRDGRIEAILPAGARIPKDHRVVDGRGLQAWPGYVALGADGLGLADDAWAGGQDAMLARGLGESFDAWSDSVELAASAGITSALVWRAPTQGKGPIIGRAAVLKMSVRDPRGALVTDLAGAMVGADALGPDGRRTLRESIEEARKDEPHADAKDDARGALMQALARGRAPLIATFDSAADVLSIAELAKELKLKLLLVTPAEAWPVAGTLAAQGVGVAQNVRYTWGKPREDRRGDLPGGSRFDAVKKLADAGVTTAVVTDSPTISLWGVAGRDLLDLPLEAAFAVRAGLTDQQAVESITIVPARLLGLDDRIGSLEPGKDADVVLLDGDPLDYRTFVRTTIVNGRIVHEAAKSRFWRDTILRRDRALKARSDQP